MTTEQNKVIVRDLIDAIGRRDLEAISNVTTPKVAAEVKDMLAWMLSLWNDHQGEITDMVAEEDKVWIRLATQGSFTGEWMGIAPNGKRWTNAGVGCMRLADGKVAQIEWYFDNLGQLLQLGATVKPG